MPILNATKDTKLADSFEECVSWWEQTKGMMFRKEVVPLVFRFPKEEVVRLHSWFCPGPIDLIFLDESWEVVDMRSEWDSWNSFSANRPFMFLLELPAGSIAHSRTQIGDVVHILK